MTHESSSWHMLQEVRESGKRAQDILLSTAPNKKDRLTKELNTTLGAIFVVANLEGLNLIAKV